MNTYMLPLPDDGIYGVIKVIVRHVVSWGLACLFLVAAIILDLQSTHWLPVMGIGSIAFSYTLYLKSSHTQFRRINEYSLLKLTAYFVVTALIIVILFSGYYCWMDLMVPSDPDAQWKQNYPDALYFSMVTFTTLGYGDFLPTPGNGRFFVIGESLMGITHMVTFVAMFLAKFQARYE